MAERINNLSQSLLNHYQRGLPLSPRPFAVIAEQLNTTESEVIACLKQLIEQGILSRVGAVFNHKALGASTLAAMQVPERRINEVANIISSYSEVNHNYLRENKVNLWFVINAKSPSALDNVIANMQHQTGLKVIRLPMEADYHIDLAFPICWQAHQTSGGEI